MNDYWIFTSSGIQAGEKCVGASLQRVDPANHALRQTRAERQMNPIPYHAEYFHEKLHIDQNDYVWGYPHVCHR